MRAYAEVLAEHGVASSLVDIDPAAALTPRFGPYFPNHPGFVKSNASVLVTGESFVVAGRFESREYSE